MTSASIYLAELDQYGERIYARGLSGDAQKWLIDRLSKQIEIQTTEGEKVRVIVRSIRNDRAILVKVS